MLERFGFTGDKLTARLGDLSGGERRRFQLLRLLLTEPNVLLLDEPTNDLDIETLNVLEDFLDDWPGTLVVVSHDRYFLERVTDSTWALLGDGLISMLPRGVEEYLERRRASERSGAARRARRSERETATGRDAGAGHQGRQRRGARGPQDAGPPRQAARSGSPPARPTSTRRWPSTPPTTSASPTSAPSSTPSSPRRRPSSSSGSRRPSGWADYWADYSADYWATRRTGQEGAEQVGEAVAVGG